VVETQADKRRIAKNTLFMYVRMLVVMAVSLFTQRVVLDKLGASDYGIYAAVGGVVAMLGFLNGTLSTGTSRFLTFELGKDNKDKLKSTFSTAFYSHLILSAIVAIILLTGGIWFVENKLIIPAERLDAAVWVLVISIFTTFVSITQVPYSSIVIAHENMSIYAYIGLLEAAAKLGIVYLLTLVSWDKLVFYATLIALVQIVIAIFYRFYCIRHYEESHLQRRFDKNIFKEMMSFSSWSLIANVSQVLGTQGLTVVMNMFFCPVIIAAQQIGNQINAAIYQFRSNFVTAINPQIIKLYAVGQYEESRKLTLETSIYVYDLMLLLSLPVIVLMEPILNLWLVEVPEYAVIFGQWILGAHLFGTYALMLYTPMMASGRLKENSYASVFVTIFGVVALYFILKAGGSVMWVQYLTLVTTLLYSYVVKPIIVCKYIPDYKWKDILVNTWQMVKVSIFPVVISIIIYRFWPVFNVWIMLLQAFVIMGTVGVSALAFMDKMMRQKLFNIVKSRLHFK
jgi:O-antigen/teichoic acid export membrane protein